VLVLSALVACGCAEYGIGPDTRRGRRGPGHDAVLNAVPQPPTVPGAAPVGQAPLGLTQGRDGLLYLPPGLNPATPAPLVVMFHGAGSNGQQVLDLVRPVADRYRFVVLAPDSRGATWDGVVGDWGADVEHLDRALRHVFERVAVDARRIVAAGFSDGASYALSIGLANGRLFSRIVAFSPGFAAPPTERGRPSVFVAHGTADRVLPVDRTGRRVVRRLQRDGYDVRYVEFAGGHSVPPEILAEGLATVADPAL
jgi:predicted esterase